MRLVSNPRVESPSGMERNSTFQPNAARDTCSDTTNAPYFPLASIHDCRMSTAASRSTTSPRLLIEVPELRRIHLRRHPGRECDHYQNDCDCRHQVFAFVTPSLKVPCSMHLDFACSWFPQGESLIGCSPQRDDSQLLFLAGQFSFETALNNFLPGHGARRPEA